MNDENNLRIITDCENQKNTHIFLHGKIMPGVQSFKCRVNYLSVYPACEMKFFPLRENKYGLEEMIAISDYKNVLEITIQEGINSIKLNGKPIKYLINMNLDLNLDYMSIKVSTIGENVGEEKVIDIKDLSEFIK